MRCYANGGGGSVAAVTVRLRGDGNGSPRHDWSLSRGSCVQKTYQVPGVSCQNCVRHVTEELEKIPGVRDIVVDLTAKTVTVDLDAEVTDRQIREGIEEAGYEVAA